MDNTGGLVFKEGDLSPGVYSFTQMRGVTSTTLVDFSCRFTWSVTDFQGKDSRSGNMSVMYNPEMKYMTSQHHSPIQPRAPHISPMYGQVYSQEYLNPPLSSPHSSTMSSPHASQIHLPPPHLQFPVCNYGYSIYPRSPITPKTFSPVLIYQRPSFTSGNHETTGRYGNGHIYCRDLQNRHGVPVQIQSEPQKNTFRLEAQSDNCKLNCQGESRGNSWNQCAVTPKPNPSLCGPHETRCTQRESVQLHVGEGSNTSAFQAWKAEDSRRTAPFQDFSPSPEIKTHLQQSPYTDSAKLKFFLDTKYGLSDSPDFPVSPDTEMGFKPDIGSSLGSEFSLETSFCDPFLDMLHDPLLPLQMDESDESKKGRKYKCPYCHVSCANNGQLKGHLRVHTGEKPYRCEFGNCGRAFARNEELTRHRRIHSGIRPHTCNTCGKKFGRKDHLNKHQKTHLKTAEKKVHVCNVTGCEQRYTRSDALARHQWGAHGIKSKSPKWRTQMREN